jgi:hypothetical protein
MILEWLHKAWMTFCWLVLGTAMLGLMISDARRALRRADMRPYWTEDEL